MARRVHFHGGDGKALLNIAIADEPTERWSRMAGNLSPQLSTTGMDWRWRKNVAHAELAKLLIVFDLSVFADTVESGYFSSKLRKRR
jgi:hypothetical protein